MDTSLALSSEWLPARHDWPGPSSPPTPLRHASRFRWLSLPFFPACGYFIVKSRTPLPRARRRLNQGFLVVTLLEAAAVAAVIFAAQKFHRLDLIPAGVGLVIGLHFFALAKVFRAPIYYFTATAITLWAMLLCILFRGNALAVSKSLGLGAVLWFTAENGK